MLKHRSLLLVADDCFAALVRKVVYGDTDSMFVLLEGRSRQDAFRIGQEIAAAITAANPSPVVLKMEKVQDSHDCQQGLSSAF